uniref:Cyclin n=1 Tax=Mucochytrium quahogii TaxID=96639 RepID=A0A7S2RVH7_9STRA|mmetsp:Transcript_6076/g.9487  ORF Transcript_6076/g.9487 Transcript_6076/m.9487 type:complete len:413 (+) Transcript_6076:345-1583(+)
MVDDTVNTAVRYSCSETVKDENKRFGNEATRGALSPATCKPAGVELYRDSCSSSTSTLCLSENDDDKIMNFNTEQVTRPDSRDDDGDSHGDSTSATTPGSSVDMSAYSPGGFSDATRGCVPSSASQPELRTPMSISPPMAHYHRYSTEDLGLHVSIAQGGLQRIRREAQTARVSLKDIVDMFGRSIASMARANDIDIKRNGWKSKTYVTDFDGYSIPNIAVGEYIWRIVRALNAHSDPALFASDGSQLSVHVAAGEEQLLQQTEGENGSHSPCSISSKKINQIVEGENSAMGRGLRCLLLAFVYIDRACTRHQDTFRVTSLSVHRVILCAIYLATKFTDDTLPRAHWTFAKLGGVGCLELKLLEGKFCELIDFSFYITEAEFQAHCMEQLRCAVRSVRLVKERSSRTTSKPN